MSEQMPHAAGAFGPGSRVGGYLLEEQIGHGGMAVVFRAMDESLGRRVALKILAPALAADEAFRQRFIRESRAAAAVDHPHITPLYQAGDANGILFIAMRYVAGGDVRSLLFRESMLPAIRVSAIIAPVASALDAAHAAGLVHRDVKPANMLLDVHPGRPDHVYLSDFGLSKAAAGSVGLTGTGLFLGTVDYAAPEQVDGQPVDGRTDQYALACAAFEMLCGEPPFRRDQGLAVLLAHRSEPPPRVTARRAGLSTAVDEVLARALAKTPEERYPSCGEFSQALDDALREPGGEPVVAAYPATEVAYAAPPARPVPVAPPAGEPTFPSGGPLALPWEPVAPSRRSARRWPVAAGAAIVVTLVAGVLLFFGHLHASGKLAATTPPATGRTSPAGQHSSTPSPSSSGPAALAEGWTSYHDPNGFAIGLPPSWAQSSTGTDDVQFTGPEPGFVIEVAWTDQPQPDALTDWRQQAASKAASDPTYHQISIRRVSYRGYNAADWAFTNSFQGTLTRVLDRGFIVRPGQLAYAIELYGPAADWAPVYRSIWPGLVASFRPAS